MPSRNTTEDGLMSPQYLAVRATYPLLPRLPSREVVAVVVAVVAEEEEEGTNLGLSTTVRRFPAWKTMAAAVAVVGRRRVCLQLSVWSVRVRAV